jgi:hypothetical protein
MTEHYDRYKEISIECSRKYRLKNKEKIKQKYTEKYKDGWPTQNKVKAKEYRIKNRDSIRMKWNKKSRHYHLTIHFNISELEYNEILKSQNYLCAICKKMEPTKNKNLCVDHCHITGKIRGLLCNKCNVGIGMLCDDEDIVKNAYEYLKKNLHA